MIQTGSIIKKLRNEKQLSQEKLAEQLQISRQSIAKWETGDTFPDIQNLITLSQFFNVSIDSLIQPNLTCQKTQLLANECPNSSSNIYDFLTISKQNTYANAKNEIEVENSFAAKFYQYTANDLTYQDRYVGNETFFGEEVVHQNGKVLWAMNYCGKVLNTNFSSSFLKSALLKFDLQFPVRGPLHYSGGQYVYIMQYDGDINYFNGTENIYFQTELVYTGNFHGGFIK